MILRNNVLEIGAKFASRPLSNFRLFTSSACILSSKTSTHFQKFESNRDDGEFRVLDVKGIGKRDNQFRRREFTRPKVPPPRTEKMSVDQVWSDVWPGPRSFHPASVPIPIRQGRNRLGPTPDKYGNAELMKVPNFLHLTPPAIKKHCEALKQFCTAWPKGLETDEKCEEHFPLAIITSDYCHSSPTIRDPLARIVTMQFNLDRLPFDRHSQDKFLRLVGDRYDEKTGKVTIVTDRCPLRLQNHQYVHYLLTALFHESWNVEEWEKEKSETDMEYYDWDKNVSKENVKRLVAAVAPDADADDPPPEWKAKVDGYREALADLFNSGESVDTLQKYKAASLKLLF